MGKEVVQGILVGFVAIVATVTLGSFAGQLYSSLAHHGGGHGKSGEHSSEEHGESKGSHGTKKEEASDESHGESSGASESGDQH